MVELSTAVHFAWQTAAFEAVEACFQSIEPVHLLVGVVSVEKLFRLKAEENLPIPSERLAAARAEWVAVSGLLERAGMPATRLRRKLRKAAGRGDCTYQIQREISRSDASRAIFKRAAALAQAAGLTRTGLMHLLAALAEGEDSALCRLLAEIGVDAGILREGLDIDGESTERAVGMG